MKRYIDRERARERESERGRARERERERELPDPTQFRMLTKQQKQYAEQAKK
jgi:hypothetical protein